MPLRRKLVSLAVLAGLLVFLPSCHRHGGQSVGPQYIMLTYNNGNCQQNGGAVAEVDTANNVIYQGAAAISQFNQRLLEAVQPLSIDRDEVVRLNEQVVDLTTLEGRLNALKQADPNVAVVIRPDRNLPVQKLVSLMDALQRADITKVGIATQEEPK